MLGMNILIKMNLSAMILIIAVFLFRQFFKYLPRKYFYFLWILVLFRLLCPVFIPINIVQFDSTKVIPIAAENIEYTGSQTTQSGGYAIEHKPPSSYTPIQNTDIQKGVPNIPALKTIAEHIIIAGIIILSIVTLIQNIFIMKRVKGSKYLKDNIYICHNISVPFVLGFLKPRIYLPAGISDPTYIIYHENVHISRRDYNIKMLFWLAVILHWYNPLVWLAFSAMENDMEMSCDERVITIYGSHIRKSYAEQLLALSTGSHQNFLPIHFIKGGVMQRVNNLFQKKTKPKLVTKIAAMIIISCIMTGCMLTAKQEQNRHGSDRAKRAKRTPLCI